MIDSPTGSTASSDEPKAGAPLSAEAQSLLGGVPDFIGDDPAAGGNGHELGGGDEDEDPIAALMAQVSFEPQDVQDTLCEFFDWLAERFDSDHWKLSDRHARMLGKPSTQLANALWAKLVTILPDVLANWAANTPGAAAFLFAVGIVVVPKVTKQVKISRQRANERKQPVRTINRAAHTVQVGEMTQSAADAVPPMR